MRKIFILIAVLICSTAYGQGGITVQNSNPTTTIQNKGTYYADSLMRVGVRDTIIPTWYRPELSKNGLFQINSANGQLTWYWNGAWRTASGGGGGTGTVTSISQAYGITLTPNPITTSGSVKVDTNTIPSKSFVTNSLRDTAAVLRVLIGSGSVTNVTATSPIISSGGATPNISADTGRATGQLVTGGSLNKVKDSLLAVNSSTYVPYTGATGNVNLGAHSITATRLNSDTLEPNTSAGLHLHNTSHQDIFIAGAGGGQNLTIYAPTVFSLLTNGSETDTFLTTTSGGLIKKGSVAATYLKKSDTASMLSPYIRSASNGLTKTSQNVTLGGSLTGATTLTTTGSNTLAIAGLQSGTTNDSLVVADASSGVLKRISSSRISGGSSGWSLTGNSGTSAGTNFLGTTDNQPLMIKLNSAERAGFNQSGGFYVGEGASTTLTGIAEGYFASSGDHGVGLGRNAYAFGYSYALGFSARAEQFHSIAIGSNARAQHDGSMVISSRKAGSDVTSSKSYQATFAFDEYRFQNGNHDSVLAYIHSGGLMAGANVPSVSLGAGAGTGASSSITGTNNNYTLSITTGSTPSISATVATITLNGITSSVNMSPVFSAANVNASALSGLQMVFCSGTTTTHVFTSGTTALAPTTTYIWNIICIPKP